MHMHMHMHVHMLHITCCTCSTHTSLHCLPWSVTSWRRQSSSSEVHRGTLPRFPCLASPAATTIAVPSAPSADPQPMSPAAAAAVAVIAFFPEGFLTHRPMSVL